MAIYETVRITRWFARKGATGPWAFIGEGDLGANEALRAEDDGMQVSSRTVTRRIAADVIAAYQS